MTSKIGTHHKDRPAYVYIRQSTAGQVRHHRESTERQYALKKKAEKLGWAGARIRILDGDLGLSGSHSAEREDFQTLVADVSMGKVGAVFALEASRLARSCTDWHRLLELCSLTGTLLIDEDGCYDPADFNDQLLLGLKGTMSQAELHFIRARLQGGKLNKAKKGELRFPLPVGLCYDDQRRIVLDPDAEVGGAVQHVFAAFRETGSAYGVVHKFGREGLLFPKRAYGGAWDGRLIWGRLTHGRVLGALKNPSYAGVYVFGRYRSIRRVCPDGTIRVRMQAMPQEEWLITIKNHHEGYITWEQFLEHQAMLEKNRTNKEAMVLRGPAREGLALLQGLLICGTCGRRVSVRYRGNGGIYPTYQCNWRRREGLATHACMTVACDLMDKAISRRVLDVLQPGQIQIALAALREVERRKDATENQWRMRIERAQYEADLAQRRYEEVDPSNRLVASTLERRWNDALVRLEQLQADYAEHRRHIAPAATPAQKAKALALAQDFPRLWNASTTQAKDRKRVLRLFIKDITVEKPEGAKKIILHIRWQGGACEDMPIELPPSIFDRLRYPNEIVEKVRTLAHTFPDQEIADALNRQGLVSPKGKAFTARMISWVRYRYSIPAPRLREPDELTVHEVAEKFRVSRHVVYYWIERGVLAVRRINKGSPYWIRLDTQKEQELREWVQNSSRIQKSRKNHGQHSERSQ